MIYEGQPNVLFYLSYLEAMSYRIDPSRFWNDLIKYVLSLHAPQINWRFNRGETNLKFNSCYNICSLKLIYINSSKMTNYLESPNLYFKLLTQKISWSLTLVDTIKLLHFTYYCGSYISCLGLLVVTCI